MKVCWAYKAQATKQKEKVEYQVPREDGGMKLKYTSKTFGRKTHFLRCTHYVTKKHIATNIHERGVGEAQWEGMCGPISH